MTKQLVSLLRNISDFIMYVLGFVVACYMINPVENIIFHWFENNADYPGNHFLTTVAAIFFNLLFTSMLHSIYIILADMANNFIDSRQQKSIDW